MEKVVKIMTNVTIQVMEIYHNEDTNIWNINKKFQQVLLCKLLLFIHNFKLESSPDCERNIDQFRIYITFGKVLTSPRGYYYLYEYSIK